MASIIPDIVSSLILRSAGDSRPIVLMTCGIAGSGKSTLAKAIVASYPSFTRISIDEIIYSRHGLYGKDYPPSKYDEYQAEADDIYLEQFQQLLQDGKNIVLDRSFYSREDRMEFKGMIEKAGARCVLVYFKADRDTLWRRICERREKGVDANCALEIDEGLLDQYVQGFEEPVGEGEVEVRVR